MFGAVIAIGPVYVAAAPHQREVGDQDPDLHGPINRALEHNLGVLLADDARGRAEGAKWRALGGMLPNIGARVSETRQQLDLAARLKNIGPLELPRLLPAFERGATEALGQKLVESLRASTGLRGLRIDQVRDLDEVLAPSEI